MPKTVTQNNKRKTNEKIIKEGAIKNNNTENNLLEIHKINQNTMFLTFIFIQKIQNSR